MHGCLDELKSLYRKLRVTSEDRVILLGDLINRGPDSPGVVRFAMENHLESILGNHELHFLKLKNQDGNYAQLNRELSTEEIQWMRKLPVYLIGPEFIAVHAGLVPGKPISRTNRDLLTRIRTWDGKGKDLKSPKNPPWYEFYHGTKPVFYGHWAKAGLNLRRNTKGLDSGCVYGNELSAYILETDRLVQVPARKMYYRP